MPRWLRRVGIEVLGWLLVVLGLLALVLPGPGLITLAAGLIVLSWRYTWARRLLVPVKKRAILLARKGVETWPRIISSICGALLLVVFGLFWGLRPPMPEWWPLGDTWWLPGGWNTSITLMASGVIALALMAYSYRQFRPKCGTRQT